jgi:20S proteasome alpha/beta subunit
MLTTWTGKHKMPVWHARRTPTLLPSQSSAPRRAVKRGLPILPLNSGGTSPGRQPKCGGPKRKLKIKNPTRRPYSESRAPVTICAAAICTDRSPEEGRPEPREDPLLVVISDGMLTSGDLEYESDQTKIFPFHDHALALVAGDYDAHMSIAVEVRRRLNGRVADISEVARLYSDAFVAFRTSRAELAILAPYGQTLDSFLSRQRQMEPGLARELARDIAEHELDVEAIIAGVDSSGPHIYHIYDPGTLDCHDGTGFFAIGLGARLFRTQFLPSGFGRHWGLPETLLLMYQAKKSAERSPGVGPTTDLLTVSREGIEMWEPEAVDALEEYHCELEQVIERTRDELCARMIGDARIFWGPPEEDEATTPSQPPTKPAEDVSKG